MKGNNGKVIIDMKGRIWDLHLNRVLKFNLDA